MGWVIGCLQVAYGAGLEAILSVSGRALLALDRGARRDSFLKLIAACEVFLEAFRAFLGDGPLTLGSVYRTPDWNRLQGGAKASQHLRGRAADSYAPRPTGKRMRLKRPKFHRLAREFAKNHPLVGGLGLYRWGVHLDTRARKNGRLVYWNKVHAGTAMHDGKKKASP